MRLVLLRDQLVIDICSIIDDQMATAAQALNQLRDDSNAHPQMLRAMDLLLKRLNDIDDHWHQVIYGNGKQTPANVDQWIEWLRDAIELGIDERDKPGIELLTFLNQFNVP